MELSILVTMTKLAEIWKVKNRVWNCWIINLGRFTTAASNGSVNSMHDSYTPLGGMVTMLLMQLGEVILVVLAVVYMEC